MHILGILFVTYLGYQIITIFQKRNNIFENIGLSFPIGMGVYTFVLYLLSLPGLKMNLANSLYVLVFLVAASQWIINKTGTNSNNKTKFRFPLIFPNSISIMLILFFMFLSFAMAVWWPINVWDALVLYDFRAKIIQETGYFYQIQSNFEYFSLYPLLTSIAHACYYIWGGNNPQAIYPLLMASFTSFFFGFLYEKKGLTTALLGTLLLTTTPTFFEHSTIAYTNLPYAIYIAAGVICLYKFWESQEEGLVVISSILFGLSTWTRFFEQFWVMGAIAVFLYMMKRRKSSLLAKFIITFLIFALPWWMFQLTFGGGINSDSDYVSFSRVIGLASFFNPGRMIEVIIFLIKYVIPSWGILFYMFFVISALECKRVLLTSRKVLYIMIFFGLGILLGGTFLFSFAYPTWKEIPDSAIRMSMFFIPLFIICLMETEIVQNTLRWMNLIRSKKLSE